MSRRNKRILTSDQEEPSYQALDDMKRRRRPFSNITKRLHKQTSATTSINSCSYMNIVNNNCTPADLAVNLPPRHNHTSTVANKSVYTDDKSVHTDDQCPASIQLVSDNKENVDFECGYNVSTGSSSVCQSMSPHVPDVVASTTHGYTDHTQLDYDLKLKELGDQLPCSLWCMDLKDAANVEDKRSDEGSSSSSSSRAHADRRADQMQLLGHHSELTARDPVWAACYDKELYKHWRSLERGSSCSGEGDECRYIDRCHIINESRRASTINLLIDLCQQMKVATSCVYLCIDILDRFLALQVRREWEERQRPPFSFIELINIACASLVISCKFEHAKRFQWTALLTILNRRLTNKAVTKRSLIAYENRILTDLQFECSVPTVHHFLCRLRILGFQYGISTELQQGYSIASCIGEYSLTSYAMLKHAPSLIAAASTYMARAICLHSKKDLYVTATSSSAPAHTYRPSFHEVWPYSLIAHTGYEEHQLMPCVKELQSLFLVETYTRARRHAYRVLEDSSGRVEACPEILNRSSYYEILLELLLSSGPSIVGEGSTVVSAMVGIAPGQSTRSSYDTCLPSILQHMQCMVHKLSADCQNNARSTLTQDSSTLSTAGDSTHAGSYALSSQRSYDSSEGDVRGELLRVVSGGPLDLAVLRKFKLHRCCSLSASEEGAEVDKDHLLSSVIDCSITNIDHLQVHDLLIYRHRSIYYKLVTYPPI